MSIYVTGCSGTYGDDLNNPNRDAWPVILGKLLDQDIVNDAVSGGTNDLMVRDIMINSAEHDTIIIGWSGIDRFTLEDSTNWINARFNKNLVQDHYSKIDYYQTYGKYHYLYWSGVVGNFRDWILQVIAVQSYCKLLNKQYYMLSGVLNHFNIFYNSRELFIDALSKIIDIKNFSDEQILSRYDEIHILLNQIDFNNFINPTDFNINMLTKSYAVGPTSHLLEEGHKKIADVMLNFINK